MDRFSRAVSGHFRHGVNYMRLNRGTIDPEGYATDWTCDWLRRYRAKHPDVPEKRAKRAALIEHMDDGIGRVISALEETGRARNTLVLFASDNGGSIPHGSDSGPLAGGKQDMLEGGIRVPMCAVWPDRVPPGSKSDRVALTMDLFPTICEAAGADFAHAIDGRSILPTLLGTPQPPEDRPLFWVRLEGGRRYQGKPYYAARHGDWKLLANDASEPLRLYQLADDPKETTDLTHRRPEVFCKLKTALEAHITRCAQIPSRVPDGTGPGEIGEPNDSQ